MRLHAIVVLDGLRTESTMNKREHWAKRAKRAKTERRALWANTQNLREGCVPPLTIRLTRIAPRPLDDDNLAASFKACRDGIADAFGMNDRDPLIRWEYSQERGKPKQYAVEVRIFENWTSEDGHVFGFGSPA